MSNKQNEDIKKHSDEKCEIRLPEKIFTAAMALEKQKRFFIFKCRSAFGQRTYCTGKYAPAIVLVLIAFFLPKTAVPRVHMIYHMCFTKCQLF